MNKFPRKPNYKKALRLTRSVSGFDHLTKLDDDYSWLELGDTMPSPSELKNVFLTQEFESEDHIDAIVRVMMNPDNLAFVCRHLIGVELLPFQSAILDTLWRKKAPMLVAGRGAGKSFILTVYALLRMLLNPGCTVIVIGAALRQSRNLFDYMSSMYEKSAILQDIVGNGPRAGPKRELDRFEFRLGTSRTIFCPTGDGSKIRGYRGNYIIADEFHSQSSEVFNVVVRGFGSTQADPIASVKHRAMLKALQKYNIDGDNAQKIMTDTFEGNQIVIAGTAFYQFNHFYKEYSKYQQIIMSKGDPKKIKELVGDDSFMTKNFRWKDFAIIQLAYSHVPEGFFDDAVIAQSKATMSSTQFHMEYSSRFSVDSDGFFKRRMLEDATCNRPIRVPSGELVQFSAYKTGESNKKYVIAVDPAAHQDNAAIVILEYHPTYRKIVHCWTTNKKKHTELVKANLVVETDYYRYIVRKVRNLMASFNTFAIVMDQHGGGTAISEAFASQDSCAPGELPIYPSIDPDEERWTDLKEGLHILHMVKANSESNSQANHGMKKDFEEKVLIFPMFDHVEISKQAIIEGENKIVMDTYEDLVFEIEELKEEITNIVCTPSSNIGAERFDTPEIKTDGPNGKKKGRLRKDRYSALLYANHYSRELERNDVKPIEYKPMGGLKQHLAVQTSESKNDVMYYGHSVSRMKNSQHAKNGYVGRA